MKAYKENIIDEIVKASITDKIISLKEIANALGVNHISTNEVLQIVSAIAKRLDNYKPAQMTNGETNESLFTTLHFVQNDVEFEDTI